MKRLHKFGSPMSSGGWVNTNRRHVSICFLLLLIAYGQLPTVTGQTATATLSGIVQDEKGAVIPGASITAKNVNTALQRQAITNERGSFTIPLLPPSIYLVTVESKGFAPVQIDNVILNVGDQKSLQIELKAGSISEMVKIEGGVALINESPALGTVVDRQFVANLPLNGRSFQSLIALTPGVVLTKTNTNEQGQFSVNGQRASANYFTIDGVGANVGGGVNVSRASGQQLSGALPGLAATGGTNNLVSVDALQEFTIQTSSYAPEFGRTPGAQVQIITRSGTNDFHGTAFEYFRNDALDANDWFANANRLAKPALRQNDFGFVIGGPLFLPRFGEGNRVFYDGRDRTFLFFSYEGLRLRQPLVAITDVPSLVTRQNAVSRMRTFLNAYPLPNGPVGANGFARFSASYSNPSTLNATSMRFDQKVSDRLSLFGRYNYAPSRASTRAGVIESLNTQTTIEFETETLTLGSTQSIASGITNDLRLNYTENNGRSDRRLDDFGGAIVPPDSDFYPHPELRQATSLVRIEGGTNSRIGIGPLGNNLQRQVNLVDNLSVLFSAHELKFGVDYRRLFPVLGQASGFALSAVFPSATTAATGNASIVSIFLQQGKLFPQYTNLSFYGQDNWRVTPRLTINYGVRWEFNPPPTEKNGNSPFAAIGFDDLSRLDLAPRGTPLYETSYSNFAPRVGFAYHLSQASGRETLLRAGFGVFYDLGNTTIASAFTGIPISVSRTLSNVPFPISFAQATPPLFNSNPPFGSVFVVDPKLKQPYTYQWNATIEQSLGINQTILLSYVAAIGRRLLQQETARPVNPRFNSAVNITRNAATSDYHALQIQFKRRLSRGLQALVSYTWSHSIDNASSDTFFNTPRERIDPRLNRGSSDFDVRHAMSSAVTYDIPSLSGRPVAKEMLRDWSVDTIFNSRSATPVSVEFFRNVPGIGFFNFRPDLVPGIPLYLNDPTSPGGRRFNNSRVSVPGNPNPQVGPFLIPVEGRQGTLGRNVLRGFPMWQLDLALRRQFNLTEGLSLQFRAEFFNIFNHPNFGDPIGSLTNNLFGTPITMLGRSLGNGGAEGGLNPLYQVGGPRSIQFALKVNF